MKKKPIKVTMVIGGLESVTTVVTDANISEKEIKRMVESSIYHILSKIIATGVAVMSNIK